MAPKKPCAPPAEPFMHSIYCSRYHRKNREEVNAKTRERMVRLRASDETVPPEVLAARLEARRAATKRYRERNQRKLKMKAREYRAVAAEERREAKYAVLVMPLFLTLDAGFLLARCMPNTTDTSIPQFFVEDPAYNERHIRHRVQLFLGALFIALILREREHHIMILLRSLHRVAHQDGHSIDDFLHRWPDLAAVHTNGENAESWPLAPTDGAHPR
ncbi:hypothetical protein DFH07DRAFT_965608 [Mycena maculata]|uniref:Uncharacterized protein n=1 Tax=Mycena maculata TaxID=230809 RepID=A0AAD7N054_9AGAR|nr:hypothetical protein DFH07DRAFT_965608 [Mycena maculata]